MSHYYHANRSKIKYLPASVFESIKRCCLFFLILFTYSSVRAQSQLPISVDQLILIPVNGDYVIPIGINSLHIEAHGARGGSANAAQCSYYGGNAVILKADFTIGFECSGNVSNFVLNPGGKLRFVLGIDGVDESAGFANQAVFGGGGGGTEVLYQAPNLTTWTLLMVAGGGGGFAGGFITGDGGGGGGYIYNGDGGSLPVVAGQAGGSTGGNGGASFGNGANGGFGFGGGGGSHIAGGGGGGYSGGGGGSASGY